MHFEHLIILPPKDIFVSQVAIGKSKTLVKYLVVNTYIFYKIKPLYHV